LADQGEAAAAIRYLTKALELGKGADWEREPRNGWPS